MRFYLYKYIESTWTWVEVSVEIEPNLSRAWDTTNDTFSCVLGVNEDAEPYKPMTAFKIVDDNNQTTIMWIINDTVTVFSLSPLCYKHSLSLVQFRYFLNKHLVRNTVFNQPKIAQQKLYTAINSQYVNFGAAGYHYAINNISGVVSYWKDISILNPHSKIKDAVLEYCFYYVRGTDETDGEGDPVKVTLQKLTTDVFAGMNSRLRTNTYVRLCDANNSDFPICRINIFEYERNNKQPLPSSVAETLNSYIRSRGNNPIHLYIEYDAGLDTGETFVDNTISKCFLKTINTALQGEYDTDIFKPIVLQINISFGMYNYSMYDVLETLLNQYKLEDDNGISKREQLFNLPLLGSDLYNLLTTTYPPDTLAFTQATFYDALTEIFRFYDAGFKFDENKTLQIEYYNDPQEQRDDIRFSGKTMSFSEKNFNNGRVAYYQNSVQRVEIPRMPVRSIGLGTPEKNEYAIIVPHPIYTLSKLTMSIGGTNVRLCNSNNMETMGMEIDLTPFIVNRSVWSVLDKSANPLTESNYQHLYQEGTIPFDRGSNVISISTYHVDWANTQDLILEYVMDLAVRRFFGQPTPQNSVYYNSFKAGAGDWHSHKFHIIYDTLVNGRLETKTINQQYNGEMIMNQSAGMIDISKLGLNILGESLKDGQPTLTTTCELTDWDNKIKEGDYIIYNGSRWVANVVNYKPIKDGVYLVTVEFSKNFNALSLRVNTDKEKRLTAISGEHATVSEDSYIDYVYVSDNNMMPVREETIFRGNTIGSLVGQTFGLPASSYDIKNIDVTSITTYGSNGEINKFGNLLWSASQIVIPLIKYGAGNCLCFEVQFSSPILAGNCLNWANNKYTSNAILYTDDEGWADLVTIRFHQNKNVVYGDYPVISAASDVAKIDKLKYYKKPNEIFALNYELCFLPIISQINSFFIGNAFIKNNVFVNSYNVNKKFYLYYDDEYEYSILDQKGYEGGNKVEIAVATQLVTTVVKLFIIVSSLIPIVALHWAICDENGDVYFASNNTKTFTNKMNSTSCIYFTTRRTKMTEQDTLVEVPPIGIPSTYTFTITPEEWTIIPSLLTNNAIVRPPYIGVAGEDVYYGSYDFLVPSLYGKTIQDLQIEDTVAGHSNTVTFDPNYSYVNPITGQTMYAGRFYGVVYTYNLNQPQTATIRYKITGQTTYSTYDFFETVPELISQNLTNVAISPSSDVSGATNSVSFDSATGRFYGTVYKYGEPNTDVTYTITYTII